MASVSEGKSIGWDQKNSAKTRAPDLKNQESGKGPRYTVQLKDSICIRYDAIQKD
jgi:hypothetical protein